jgi:DNA phosphorothioation-dependent restriction protein DptG
VRIKEFKFLNRDGVDTVESEGVDFGVEETDFILNSKEASDDDACSEQCEGRPLPFLELLFKKETSCSSSYSAFSNK